MPSRTTSGLHAAQDCSNTGAKNPKVMWNNSGCHYTYSESIGLICQSTLGSSLYVLRGFLDLMNCWWSLWNMADCSTSVLRNQVLILNGFAVFYDVHFFDSMVRRGCVFCLGPIPFGQTAITRPLVRRALEVLIPRRLHGVCRWRLCLSEYICLDDALTSWWVPYYHLRNARYRPSQTQITDMSPRTDSPW